MRAPMTCIKVQYNVIANYNYFIELYDNCFFTPEQIERAFNGLEDITILIEGYILIAIIGEGPPVPIGHVVKACSNKQRNGDYIVTEVKISGDSK